MGTDQFFGANYQGTLSTDAVEITAVKNLDFLGLSQVDELPVMSVGFPSIVYQFTPVVAATRQ